MRTGQYVGFRGALLPSGASQPPKGFRKTESATFSKGCLPIEELPAAAVRHQCLRAAQTDRLWDPRWGDLFDRRGAPTQAAYRGGATAPEDRDRPASEIWGFQTKLKWAEQKRVFRLIPGWRTPRLCALPA